MINAVRTLKVTAPLVNVRKAASLESEIIDTVQQGMTFPVVEPYSPSDDFVKITYKGETRFISKKFTTVITPRTVSKNEQHTK